MYSVQCIVYSVLGIVYVYLVRSFKLWCIELIYEARRGVENHLCCFGIVVTTPTALHAYGVYKGVYKASIRGM